MTELLTAAQMKAIEAAAIASGKVTGLELMERAGRGVVEAIFAEWPELAAGSFRAVVLCGPGGNGGDGFVVARLLKEWGWEVEVFLYGTVERMPADAKVNYERWLGMGEIGTWDDTGIKTRYETNNTGQQVLVVDALFGTGLSRQMPRDTAAVWQGFMSKALSYNAQEPNSDRFVAIDFPSGICSDSGKDMGALPTHLTVTFHSAKVGHYMSEGCQNYGGVIGCGKVVVQDIGLKKSHSHSVVRLISGTLRSVGKRFNAHKFSQGHALILSGPSGRGGAARLAARGALRIGAGVVTVACPAQALAENAARLDAVMLRVVADGAGLAQVLSDPRINALCIGPGLGTGAREAGLLAQALGSPPPPTPPHEGEGRHSGQAATPDHQALPLPLVGRGEGWGSLRATVLDADALTILSQYPDLLAALNDRCVLTPHAGEFARLFPDIAAKLAEPAIKGPAYSKVDATREAAARVGCVVLYKGADTVIAAPDGRCAINAAVYERSAPWLATAGSGDVLAGFITGLLARGFDPFDAACTAAWLHVECARSFGPGLIAEDLPEELPKVFRQIGV